MLAFFTHIILSYTYRDHKYILTAAFLARVHLRNAKGFLYLFTRILHIDTSRNQPEDIAVYLITHQGLSSKPGESGGMLPLKIFNFGIPKMPSPAFSAGYFR